MKCIEGYRRAQVAVMAFTLVGLGGCIEYRIETTLNADGSGVRHEEMIVGNAEDAGVEVSDADFGELMSVTEEYRWTHGEEVEDGDTVDVFQRDTPIRDLAGWADVGGDVHMRGSISANSDSRVGHMSLGDVHFRNSVRVETGRVAEGTSYTYRETFYWENLVDLLIEYMLEPFRATLAAQYPDLAPEQRGEIVGFARGGLWSAVDAGLLDAGGDEEEKLVSAFIDRAAEQAVKIVRQSYPDADRDFFSNTLRQLYDDGDDGLETFIKERLPGVELAGNSEIIFRLNMPGRVARSNAQEQAGDTLIWEFGPGDALTDPVEIFAESVVEK